jgi:hypothetical protein
MQRHEYYEELCALLPISQLSVEEHQELAEHLRGCASCRNATDDFSAILDKMPVGEMDVDERVFSNLQDDSYRARFLTRAISEGVPLSRAVLNSRSSIKRWSWPQFRLLPILAAATAVIIATLSIQLVWLSKIRFHPSPQRLEQNEQLPPSSGTAKNEGLVSDLEVKLRTLKNQAIQEQAVISDLEAKMRASRIESHVATERWAATVQELAQIRKKAGDTDRALDQAKADVARLRSEKDGADAALVEQQYKIAELTAQVKEKDSLAERERQLNAVTRDVRDLMGARNLHILDVSDVDGNGRSSKSFGRVFLVEGKSLIFYAFDLGDRGNPSKVSFQAWAQAEGRQTMAKSLGVFYIDDHAQKRWVLKVSDPEKLRAISSVFVTVEPLGGTERPTGKKLLYAYLGTKANHP